MREPARFVNTPAIRSTLQVVQDQFEAWRKTRRRRCRIPDALWKAAVEQCRGQSICAVSAALRLNYNTLRSRVAKTRDPGVAVGQGPDFGFVKLDLGAPITPSECLVEMEVPNGTKMRMSFKGASREFDPVELSRAFWRQGR
jgi:hypothetical protein